MADTATVTAGPDQSPPGLVRLERRLGLPVPLAWRPWVAEDLLSPDWARRTVARRCWIRAHRSHLIVAVVVFEAAVLVVTFTASSLAPSVSVLAITPTLILLKRSRVEMSDDELVIQAREQSLRWNGLRPDGSLDPVPDRWMSFAALPQWVVVTVGVVELVAAVAVAALVVGILLAPVILAIRALH